MFSFVHRHKSQSSECQIVNQGPLNYSSQHTVQPCTKNTNVLRHINRTSLYLFQYYHMVALWYKSVSPTGEMWWIITDWSLKSQQKMKYRNMLTVQAHEEADRIYCQTIGQNLQDVLPNEQERFICHRMKFFLPSHKCKINIRQHSTNAILPTCAISGLLIFPWTKILHSHKSEK